MSSIICTAICISQKLSLQAVYLWYYGCCLSMFVRFCFLMKAQKLYVETTNLRKPTHARLTDRAMQAI